MRALRSIRVGCSIVLLTIWVGIFMAVFAIGFFAPGEPATFPAPVDGQAVYDPAGVLSGEVERALETRIDAIEARSGAEIAVYAHVDPGATEESNLAAAGDLMEQWGVGREGFDDGLVILVSLQEDLVRGKVSLFGGAGFLRGYLSEGDLQSIIDEWIIPAAIEQRLDGGLILAVDAVDAAITSDGTARLNFLRQLNGVLGVVVAPIALLVAIGLAFRAWRREGDDPEVLDSPSILMAGPPAEMTPALASVVRGGKATRHSVNTILIEMASTGRIAFRNLDRAGKVNSDDDPDPLTDPAIEVSDDAPRGGRLGLVEREAWALVRRHAQGGKTLTRERLWILNDLLEPIREALEVEVVQLGWFTRRPSSLITVWSAIGIGEMVAGGLALVGGFAIPMSGLTLLGAALGAGGLASWGIGQFMSQRTAKGAYVDAMLKAYRRTLEKTLEQARNMQQVVADETVRMLADTPDKAVVWGFALGLHDMVADVLRRGLEDQAADPRAAQPAYYPIWLGGSPSSFSSAAGGAGGFAGGGSIFSGSGVPDIGGMFSAVGSIGSSPASSSSGGGGFGGGSSGGGGGGSGSF
ncbi:MAG TPA: TPM domain-containing protein [Candidatus Limnocylindria bacterium]|nr:TPM domain-containing protein [Candidatus Limnocylindria bacterium]